MLDFKAAMFYADADVTVIHTANGLCRSLNEKERAMRALDSPCVSPSPARFLKISFCSIIMFSFCRTV